MTKIHGTVEGLVHLGQGIQARDLSIQPRDLLIQCLISAVPWVLSALWESYKFLTYRPTCLSQEKNKHNKFINATRGHMMPSKPQGVHHSMSKQEIPLCRSITGINHEYMHLTSIIIGLEAFIYYGWEFQAWNPQLFAQYSMLHA